MKTQFLVVGFVVGMAVAGARAETVTLVPVLDNTMFSNGNSSGAGWYIFGGRTGSSGGGQRQRGLMAFDFARTIPAGSTIQSVQLTLWMISAGPDATPDTFALQRVTAEWGEGESDSAGGFGAPPTEGDATWTHRLHPTDAWLNSGGDFVFVNSATTTIGLESGDYVFPSSPGLVNDVQGWLDGSNANFGWVLRGNETGLGSARKFGSREFDAPEIRPRLLVTFDPQTGCTGDLDESGDVGFDDLVLFLDAWGFCKGCPEDFDGSGDVGFDDLLALLGNWGPC